MSYLQSQIRYGQTEGVNGWNIRLREASRFASSERNEVDAPDTDRPPPSLPVYAVHGRRADHC
jgi:hypothetical protein